MTHQATSGVRPPGAIRGIHVLVAMLAFFGVIFVVNGYFLYQALATNTGVVALEPYRKGLAYNARIAADEEQSALGLSGELKIAADGQVVFDARDRSGTPLSGSIVRVMVGRPSNARFDRHVELIANESGMFTGSVGSLESGTWLAAVEIREFGSNKTIYRARNRLWLQPSR